MKKILVIVLAVLFGVALVGLDKYVYAKTGEIKADPVNTICPVMGTKVSKDTPYRVEYEGKTIGLCCPICVNAFKADPKKYGDKALQQVEAQKANETVKKGDKK